jgi:hypothetical protein
MSLKATNLVVQSSQLSATFKGGPNDLLTQMIRRLKILSPSGTNFLFIGDSEPTSNVGPWLKGGTQWWVWDESTKRYKPQDVSASVTIPFKIGLSIPTDSTPPVWLKTTADATDQNPLFGDPVGWYVWDGSAWIPFNSIVLAGPTANRPSAPVDLQQYYDTTISCLIWWERGAWRTVSGVPGDVKMVAFPVLTDALTANPGWDVFGGSNLSYRGRILMQACKDAGTNPQSNLPPPSGVTSRAAFETFGDGTLVAINPASGPTAAFPVQMAIWHLVKL